MSIKDEHSELLKTKSELTERIAQAAALIASLAEDDPEMDAACARLIWATREVDRINALLWGHSDSGDRIEFVKID